MWFIDLFIGSSEPVKIYYDYFKSSLDVCQIYLTFLQSSQNNKTSIKNHHTTTQPKKQPLTSPNLNHNIN